MTPRPHLRDLDVVGDSARAFFAEKDVLRRLVTPSVGDEPLWTSDDHDEELSIRVSEEEFVMAFAEAYVSSNLHWDMETTLFRLTGFGHAHGGTPELHVSSAFHDFIEYHPPRHEEAVRRWVSQTRVERPFPTWTWVVVEIEERWLEWDDVQHGRRTDGGRLEFTGLATAAPSLDDLGLFNFVPTHLMQESGKRWPPREGWETPRHRTLPVEFIARLIPRDPQQYDDMDVYLDTRRRGMADMKKHRAEWKARKKLEKIKHAVSVEPAMALIAETFGETHPEFLAGISLAADKMALEALVAKYLEKASRPTDPGRTFF